MKNDWFAVFFMFSTILGFSGWYFAECDNEILRKELSTYSNGASHK